MLSDLNQVSRKESQFSNFDVAIVGAGAAGITLALKLASYGKKTALIEAGGRDFSEESQEIYRAKTVGDPYFELDTARLRHFGGTTNHWSGWCRTFEPEDFNRRYLGEEYNWPIEFEELDRFRTEACDILEISSIFKDKILDSQRIESIGFNFSPPVRFGDKYYERLITDPLIHVFLNSNLVDITHSLKCVNSVKVASYNNKVAFINANNFVFAMGGIENSRYLLWLQLKYQSDFISKISPLGENNQP